MSSTPAETPKSQTPAKQSYPDTIRIYGHSMLFYFWPVWLLGYLFALITLIDGHYMALVPQSANQGKATIQQLDQHKEWEGKKVQVIFADETAKPPMDLTSRHMTKYPLPGVIFALVLAIVVFVTNVTLRGLMSYMVIASLVILALLIYSFGLFPHLANYVALLDIRINMGGYLFISTLLVIIWALAFYFFDKQTYAVFTTGQVKVCAEVGEGEKVYDVTGLHFEKQRSDLFRHILLGFGSGDLIVRTTGADTKEFRFDNVLNIDKKLKDIEQLIGSKKQVTVNPS
ncbi:MAG: hypothetical protein KJS91_16045 [Planctomycetes bacterium]|jgi:hypothetical protein|nr:hypothetical protein [Planctomycetota bacterium]